MPRKKPDVIPEVDIVKSGINMDDKYEDIRTDTGHIRITRSREGLKIKEDIYLEKLREEEEKLEKLRQKVSNVGVRIKDVKSDKKLSKKERKKLEKLEKKKNRKKSYEETLLDAVPGDLSEFIDGFRNGKKKKKHHDDEPLQGLRKKEKKEKNDDSKSDKDDKKKERSEVAESFKEVERITKENIKEIESTIKLVDAQLKDLTSAPSRMRGRDTAISNYLQAKSALINAKQSAAKDILSTRSKVYDIEMKKEKQVSSESASHVELLAKVFPSIVANGKLAGAIADDISNSGKNKDSKKKKKGRKIKGKDVDVDQMLESRERELVKSGEIEYNAYDENIDLEGKYTVAIKKSWSTGDWKFVAVDKHGEFMDVPKKLLPKKSSVSLRFDDEKDTAQCGNSGNVYRVYQLPNI